MEQVNVRCERETASKHSFTVSRSQHQRYNVSLLD